MERQICNVLVELLLRVEHDEGKLAATQYAEFVPAAGNTTANTTCAHSARGEVVSRRHGNTGKHKKAVLSKQVEVSHAFFIRPCFRLVSVTCAGKMCGRGAGVLKIWEWKGPS